jgi:RHS repeat-associated protein
MVWSLADRLGSIDVLVNEQGLIIDQRTYDSFGNTLSQLDPNVKFRFGYTGRESDPETGLYYYRARYFDANVGRFISTDPIGFEAGDSNLYRYVFNNSTTYTDPSGEIIPLLAIGAAILGAGLTAAAFGGAYGFARGAAQSIDSDRKNGLLSWDSIGSAYIHGLIGGVQGAATGFVAGAAVAGAAIGAVTIGVPTVIVGATITTLAIVGVGLGVFSAGANIAQGNYATAAVDLAGAFYGANKLFSAYKSAQEKKFDIAGSNARRIYQTESSQLNNVSSG